MNEKKLIKGLKKRRAEALLQVVRDHGDNLLIFAFTLMADPEESYILVHDVLLSLWEKSFAEVALPLHTFLYNQVRAAAGRRIKTCG